MDRLEEIQTQASSQGPDKQYERILCINDVHIPYHDEEKFHWIVENYKGKVDFCVVRGDFSDLLAFSRFDKRPGSQFTAVQEMRAVAANLVYLAESFPKVVMMNGNHDNRIQQFFLKRGNRRRYLGCPNVQQARSVTSGRLRRDGRTV